MGEGGSIGMTGPLHNVGSFPSPRRKPGSSIPLERLDSGLRRKDGRHTILRMFPPLFPAPLKDSPRISASLSGKRGRGHINRNEPSSVPVFFHYSGESRGPGQYIRSAACSRKSNLRYFGIKPIFGFVAVNDAFGVLPCRFVHFFWMLRESGDTDGNPMAVGNTS
jgi:hypothetical protein